MTIAFVGGSNAQQQAITAAHTALSTAVPAASTAAGQGGPSFTTWFGSGPTAAVAAAYDAVTSALGSAAFTYDLTAAPATTLLPGVCVAYLELVDTAVTGQVWAGFWPNYYLDNAGAGTWLAGSIFHEIAIAFATSVSDFGGVTDAVSAQALAAVAPESAVQSAINLEGFLGDLVQTEG